MQMKAVTAGNVEVLVLSGRFESHVTGEVNDWIKGKLSYGHSRIVVDLGGVGFLDSTALATLVRNMKACREAGGDLVLANLQETVVMIFELTRLDNAFYIYPDAKVAVRSFSG